MRKNAITILLLIVLVCGLAPAVQAQARDPYTEISAVDFDDTDLRTAEGKRTFEADQGYIGSALATDAVIYRGVDFKTPPARARLYAGVPAAYAGAVELRVDSYDGPVLAEFSIKGSSWDSRTEHDVRVNMEISGTHDLYLVWTKGTCHIFSFSFVSSENVRAPYILYDGSDTHGIEDPGDRFYYELLRGLGLFERPDDPAFPVTRGTFAKAVAWALNGGAVREEEHFSDVPKGHPAFGAVAQLKALGVVNGYNDLTFRPDEFITADEAASMCVAALGYGKLGDAAYRQRNVAAQKQKLLAGVNTGAADLPVNTLQASRLLYNFFSAEYMFLSDFYNGGVEKQKNILETTRGIEFRTGIVTGNEVTLLDDPGGKTAKGYVLVDDADYLAGNSGIRGYLGRRCTFLAEKDDDGGYTILSVAQARGAEEYVITHNEEPRMAGGRLCYTSGSREKSLAVSQDTVIIYNGKPYENAEISLLLEMQNYRYENGGWVKKDGPEKEFRGEIRAVSYTGGSRIDIIFVNAYVNIVYDGYNSYSHVINDKLSGDTFYMDNEEQDSYATVMLNGLESGLGDLPSPAAGIVYESLNQQGVKVLNAYFSTENVQGTVTGTGDDRVMIDGAAYAWAQEYKQSTAAVPQIQPGRTGIFLVNPFGEIVWFSPDGENERLGVFVRHLYDPETEEQVRVKLYDFEAGLAVYPMRERCTLDGLRRRDCGEIVNGMGQYEGSGLADLKAGVLVKFKVSAGGEITVMDTPVTNVGGRNDCLRMLSAELGGENLIYKRNPRVFGNSSEGNKYAVRENAVLLTQPAVDSDMFKNGEGFSRQPLGDTLGNTDKYHTVTLYAAEEDSSLASVVVKYVSGSDYNNDVVIFKGFDNVLDRNQEPAVQITVDSYGRKAEYVVSSSTDASQFKAMAKGTLLRLCFDSFGEVNGAQAVYAPEGGAGAISPENPENTPNVQSELRYVYASVLKKEDIYLKIAVAKDGVPRTEFINTTGVSVSICEGTDSGFRTSRTDAGAVSPGDKMVVVMSYGIVKQIVMYK